MNAGFLIIIRRHNNLANEFLLKERTTCNSKKLISVETTCIYIFLT